MLAEHEFVTPLEAKQALSEANFFLSRIGFHVTNENKGELQAARGRLTSCPRLVWDLPQFVAIRYDLGRITVVAAIVPRGNEEKKIHATLTRTLIESLEKILVRRERSERLVQDWLSLCRGAGKVWTNLDIARYVVIGTILAGSFLAGLIYAFVGGTGTP